VCAHRYAALQNPAGDGPILFRLKRRSVYGIQTSLRQDIGIAELMYRKEQVVQSELDVIEGHIFRNNIEVIQGTASLRDAHILQVTLPDGA